MSAAAAPEFIILVSTYNRAHLLDRLISSVVSQEYSDWLLLFNDDGSSDSTQEKLTKLEQEDKRIRYFRMEQNSGVNAVRNRLIDLAQEINPDAYLAFIDDDDYLAADALKTAAATITSHPGFNWYALNCVYADGKPETRITQYGQLSYLRDYMFGKSLRGDFFSLVKASAIGDTRFTTQFRNAEEWYFWSHLAQKFDLFAEDKAGSVKEYLPDGLSHSGMNRDKAIEVLRFKLSVLEPMVGLKMMRHQYVSLAKHLIKQGKKSEAKDLLARVFRDSPLYFRQYRHWLKVLFS